MNDKKYYDIHALEFAHKTCADLAEKAIQSGNMNTAHALLDACDVFVKAIMETDMGNDELRKELEGKALADPKLSWSSYKHEHCEAMSDMDTFEMNVPEYGDE